MVPPPQAPRRVVVTGVGMVTPLGNTAAETWKNLLAGQSGVGQITRFDTTGATTFTVIPRDATSSARLLDKATSPPLEAA